MTFTIIDEDQVRKLEEWRRAQMNKNATYGVSGGRFTYQFTPTSLGMIIKVVDNLTKEELDLTDYDSW